MATYGDVGLNNVRGYIIGHLANKMEQGKSYCVKYYLNLPNFSKWAVNKLGCYFDDGTLLGSSADKCHALNVIPHIDNNPSVYLNDTLGWMKIQGIYTANGSETHLTLGNFYNDANTGHVFFNGGWAGGGGLNIDDISVIPIEIEAYAGNDTTICIEDSVHLGYPQEIGLECLWYKPNENIPFATTSDIWFKPTQAGTYTFIQKMDNCKITFDTVNITVVNDCNSLQPMQSIPNVFTPNADGVNDLIQFNLGLGNRLNSFTIYNRWGNKIKEIKKTDSHNYIFWDGKTTSEENSNAGVYFYVLEYASVNKSINIKNGYITLLK